MIDERRKKLASLSFTEKIRILEKLRDRSLALASSRKKAATQEERRQKSIAASTVASARAGRTERIVS